ncbi:Crp/Fnr family transcriptional regulator [Pontibacterium sp.]|uniref:Crp/Fnr family transcriptional regulator n=1 Tax=Pontibacterium sp. TaxID=2036026 RepID=UPI00351210DB
MEILDAKQVIYSLGMPYFRELATFGALSDEAIQDLLNRGKIMKMDKGDFITMPTGESSFKVVLQGKMAFYRGFEERHVLTRYFEPGEQMGFDWMIGLISHEGTDVAVEDSVIVEISSQQFFDMHVDHPADFGLFMINLSRELSREIAMLEDVIGKSTGWQAMEEGKGS